jgi:hypothetical protein
MVHTGEVLLSMTVTSEWMASQWGPIHANCITKLSYQDSKCGGIYGRTRFNKLH